MVLIITKNFYKNSVLFVLMKRMHYYCIWLRRASDGVRINIKRTRLHPVDMQAGYLL